MSMMPTVRLRLIGWWACDPVVTSTIASSSEVNSRTVESVVAGLPDDGQLPYSQFLPLFLFQTDREHNLKSFISIFNVKDQEDKLSVPPLTIICMVKASENKVNANPCIHT